MPAPVETKNRRCHRLVKFISNFNLYTDTDELPLVNQLWSTRCYAAGLPISLCILLIFTGIYPNSYTVSVSSPSLRDFENFVASYGSTPTCRCTQASIVHEQFLAFKPQFHRVCSSDFITESWISSLFNVTTSNYYPLDFHLTASAQFQALELLCRIASEVVSDALKAFLSSSFISTRTLLRAAFNAYMSTVFNQFKTDTTTEFSINDRFVTSAIEQLRLISALRTNFYTTSVPGSDVYKTHAASYPKRRTRRPCRRWSTRHADVIKQVTASILRASTASHERSFPAKSFHLTHRFSSLCLDFKSDVYRRMPCFSPHWNVSSINPV